MSRPSVKFSGLLDTACVAGGQTTGPSDWGYVAPRYTESFADRLTSALRQNQIAAPGESIGKEQTGARTAEQQSATAPSSSQRASKRALRGACGTLEVTPVSLDLWLVTSRNTSDSLENTPPKTDQVSRLRSLLCDGSSDPDRVAASMKTPYSILPFIRLSVNGRLVYRSKIPCLHPNEDPKPELLSRKTQFNADRNTVRQRIRKNTSEAINEDYSTTKHKQQANLFHQNEETVDEFLEKKSTESTLFPLATSQWSETLVCFLKDPFAAVSIELCDLDGSISGSGGMIWDVIASKKEFSAASLRPSRKRQVHPKNIVLEGYIFLPPVYASTKQSNDTNTPESVFVTPEDPGITGSGSSAEKSDFDLRFSSVVFARMKLDLAFISLGWRAEISALCQKNLLDFIIPAMWMEKQASQISGSSNVYDSLANSAEFGTLALADDENGPGKIPESRISKFSTLEVDIQEILHNLQSLKNEAGPLVETIMSTFVNLLEWKNKFLSSVCLIVIAVSCWRPYMIVPIVIWSVVFCLLKAHPEYKKGLKGYHHSEYVMKLHQFICTCRNAFCRVKRRVICNNETTAVELASSQTSTHQVRCSGDDQQQHYHQPVHGHPSSPLSSSTWDPHLAVDAKDTQPAESIKTTSSNDNDNPSGTMSDLCSGFEHLRSVQFFVNSCLSARAISVLVMINFCVAQTVLFLRLALDVLLWRNHHILTYAVVVLLCCSGTFVTVSPHTTHYLMQTCFLASALLFVCYSCTPIAQFLLFMKALLLNIVLTWKRLKASSSAESIS